MIVSDEVLLYYAQHYDITFSTVKRLYNVIKDIPCVNLRDDSTFLYCLETFINDRAEYEVAKEIYPKDKYQPDYKERARDIRQSMDYALYTAYEDDAIPFLSEEFKREKQIFNKPKDTIFYNDNDDDLNFDGFGTRH